MLPVRLYKDQPHWIRPLDKDIETVFSKEKNKAFRTGKCIRWILEDDSADAGQAQIIGRVAAFVSHRSGGMGFFECINDRSAAFVLFDQCKTWLQQQGMEYMDGPINFGDRDRWWGLLVDGYDKDPNYQCNYHLPYYRELFEAYGFQLYFNQYTFGRKREGPLNERLYEKARLVEKDPNYSFRHLKRSEIDSMPGMVRHIYNKAWARRGEIPELTELQAKNIVNQMKPIMDEKLLWFGFYKDEPIIFFLSLPEVNQIFKHLNGQFNWWGKLKFLWYRFRKVDRKAVGLLFGVVPEHQGKGVDGAIILHFRKLMQDEYKRYDEFELNWIGDFNPRMIRVAEQVETDIVKTHITYRYLFDRNKPFERMPFISK